MYPNEKQEYCIDFRLPGATHLERIVYRAVTDEQAKAKALQCRKDGETFRIYTAVGPVRGRLVFDSERPGNP